MVIIFCLPWAFCCGADWRAQVDELLERGCSDVVEVDVNLQKIDHADLEKVAAAVPSWQSLMCYLQSRPLRQSRSDAARINHLTGRVGVAGDEEALLLNTIIGSDGIARPWVLYLPRRQAKLQPQALLVALHGGVSRKSIYEDPVMVVKDSPWLELARARGCLALFPFGQEGAAWWDETGIINVRQLIRAVKTHFNVDDNRVWLAGFSDGASAGFMYAMILPDDFAAVVALNGHMGVGSLDGGLPLYAPNLAMTPVYAVTTTDDELYPTRKMQESITMAQEAGAQLVHRSRPGTHAFDYHADELPSISRFLNRQIRNPFPEEIFWESGDRALGRCRWLQISGIAASPAAAWHSDHNCILTSEEITWGFTCARGNEGIIVHKISPDGYAEQVGLRPGDVVRRAGGRPISSSFSMRDAKDSARCGSRFDFVVSRSGREITLPGTLPQPEMYYLFERDVPSAAVKAVQKGNLVTLDGSRVARLQILVHPDQFDLDRPLKVVYNGRCLFDGMVKPDPLFILKNYAACRDRKAIFAASVDLVVTGLP